MDDIITLEKFQGAVGSCLELNPEVVDSLSRIHVACYSILVLATTKTSRSCIPLINSRTHCSVNGEHFRNVDVNFDMFV